MMCLMAVLQCAPDHMCSSEAQQMRAITASGDVTAAGRHRKAAAAEAKALAIAYTASQRYDGETVTMYSCNCNCV